MSGFDSLLESIQRTYAEIAQVESVAKANPGDIYLLANLNSLQRRARSLEVLWEEAALKLENEVCRYRILPVGEERYPIRQVTLSLFQFQEMFSQIYDAAKNKIKSRKQITADVAEETALNFGYAYPGSLGIAMTVPSGSNLFAEGKFDEAVSTVVRIMRLHEEGEVRQVAEKYGIAVLRRAYDWSKTNAASGYGVDLSWLQLSGGHAGGTAEVNDFQRIVELIERTLDEEKRTRELFGTLVGIDTQTMRFRFVAFESASYAGMLADDFPTTVQWAVNTNYGATIEETSTTSYATEEMKTTYRLKALTKMDGSKKGPASNDGET